MGLAHGYYQQPGHVVAAGVVLPLLAVVAVGLRLWTRLKQGQGVRADDWLVLPAALLTVGQGINLVVGVALGSLAAPLVIPPGFEANPLAIRTPQVVAMGKAEFFFELTLPLVLGFVKLSFLLFYVRIFVVSRAGAVSLLLHGLVAVVSLWMLACFLALLFECRLRFWAAWGSALDIVQNCDDTFAFVYAVCLSDFIVDVLIILIPIPLVWRLKVSRRKKLAMIAVFLLGAVAVAASLTRLIITLQLVYSAFDPSSDEILVVTTYMYWGVVECAVGILAACLPSLSLLARLLSFESAWQSFVSVFSSGHSRTGSAVDGSRTDAATGEVPSPPARGRKRSDWSDDVFPLTDVSPSGTRETV
ncbi:hypothetical protein CDD83_3224 [Cordyceps sp. RAO-2017]|nr:hypothetical protein CDD83_3224 [Cordyceps sp. RAO-2017]